MEKRPSGNAGWPLCFPDNSYKIRKASNSGEILTCSGINLQLVADIDEQRNHDLSTGLHDRRLGGTRCGVALDTRLSLGNFQLNKERSFQCKYGSVGVNGFCIFEGFEPW